ncbi:MAG TPA: glucose-6-phosphate dehydrogenase, partial [Micrococcus luteus]|nr:glucose-6-phosphate dehydrogenase [Micrococcus luteus]
VGLDPREVRIELAVDGADTPFDAERRTLAADLGEEQVDAYGEVLRGILTGQTLLSVRGDAAEECWRILAPVLAAWEAEEVPLDEYPAGSAGPAGGGGGA